MLKCCRALERVQNIKRNTEFNVLLQYLLPWLLLLLIQRFQILPVHQFVTNSYCSPCTVILPVLRRLILFLLPFAQPPPVQASNSYHVLIYRFFCHRICFSFFFGELQIPLALQFIAIFFLHSLQFFFLLLLLFLLLPLPDFFRPASLLSSTVSNSRNEKTRMEEKDAITSGAIYRDQCTK